MTLTKPRPLPPVPLQNVSAWEDYYHGYMGPNRHQGHCQIEVGNDLEAVVLWLRVKGSRSRATFDAFSKEANRFLCWAAIERDKRLSDITVADLEVYQRFLQDPQPANRWVGPHGRRRPPTGEWFPPFTRGLNDRSIETAMRILGGLFAFLVGVNYLAGNPFVAITITAPAASQTHLVERFLTATQWQAVKAAIEALPRNNGRERNHYHRCRWVLHLLYYTGLRRAEVVTGRMRDFELTSDGRILRVLGKGRKHRRVPVPAPLAQELALYRQSLQLPPWPSPQEDTPLVVRMVVKSGEDDRISPSTLHRIVKTILSLAADQLEAGAPADAARLRTMSNHWFRHTYATELLDRGVDMAHAQDILGHSDINTTRGYSHVKEQQRIAQVERAFDTDLGERNETR